MTLVHLHLMLNHVPVVGALFLVVLFAAAAVRGNTTLLRTALWTCAVLAAVAAAVFFTGEPAEHAVERLAGTSEPALERHEDVATIATILLALTGVAALAALRWMHRRVQAPRWLAFAGLGASLAVAVVMGVTANLGGQVRHEEIRAGAAAAGADGAETAGRDDDRDH